MGEGLKLVVGADFKQAEKALKDFTGTTGKEGAKAGTALTAGLNKAIPPLQKIPAAVKPARLAVSKLGDTIETLRAKALANKEFIRVEKDVARIALLNREIKALESEITRVQSIGAGGINLGGVGTAAKKGFSALRTAANILPGIGIAGILGTATDAISGLFSQADRTNEKVKELLVSIGSISSEAAAGTAGEASKVNALVSIISNQTNAYEKRNRALNELKGINKNYFGDLTLEASKLGLLRQRADEYTKAIIQQAVIKKFTDQIADVAVELSKQIPIYAQASAKASQLQRNLAKLNGEDFFFENIKLNDARAEVNSAGAVVNKLTDQSKKLNVALRAAVEESLKFKPLEDDTKAGARGVDNLIDAAKRLAAFLDKNTQFSVTFEVDPSTSEAEQIASARAFIAKARSFIEKQTPEFHFKPIVLTEFKLKFNERMAEQLRELSGIEATRTYKEVKKAFEDEIKRRAEADPLVANVTADVNAAIKNFDANQKNLGAALGLNIKDSNAVGALSKMQQQAIATANTVNSVLQPAFDGLFAAIKAGENPVKAFFQSLGQALLQLLQKIIAAAIQAAILSAIFTGGIGTGAGAVKGFGGFFKNIMGFASGGLVSGPTLGLVGEGFGTSRSNPEVIAPLDQLRGMLSGLMGEGGGGPVMVWGDVRNNRLRLLGKRADKQARRLQG